MGTAYLGSGVLDEAPHVTGDPAVAAVAQVDLDGAGLAVAESSEPDAIADRRHDDAGNRDRAEQGRERLASDRVDHLDAERRAARIPGLNDRAAEDAVGVEIVRVEHVEVDAVLRCVEVELDRFGAVDEERRHAPGDAHPAGEIERVRTRDPHAA